MQEKVVDLRDITGTGYISQRRIFQLIISFPVMLLGVLLCLIGLLCLLGLMRVMGSGVAGNIVLAALGIMIGIGGYQLYKGSRATFFNIEFAGGNISFDTSWYSKEEVDKFQLELRKCMATIKDTEPVYAATGAAIHNHIAMPTSNNSREKDRIESLREYAKLKEEGILGEEEFQSIKDNLISEKQ